MLFLHFKYLHFCPDFFGHVGKRLEKKAKVNFKIYDVANCTTNNYSPHIVQYLRKHRKPEMKFRQLIEYNMRNIFIEKSSIKCCQQASPRLFYKNQY